MNLALQSEVEELKASPASTPETPRTVQQLLTSARDYLMEAADAKFIWSPTHFHILKRMHATLDKLLLGIDEHGSKYVTLEWEDDKVPHGNGEYEVVHGFDMVRSGKHTPKFFAKFHLERGARPPENSDDAAWRKANILELGERKTVEQAKELCERDAQTRAQSSR